MLKQRDLRHRNGYRTLLLLPKYLEPRTNTRYRRCLSNTLLSKGTTWSNPSENHARLSSTKISVGYAYQVYGWQEIRQHANVQ
jgi:hypothetical protein